MTARLDRCLLSFFPYSNSVLVAKEEFHTLEFTPRVASIIHSVRENCGLEYSALSYFDFFISVWLYFWVFGFHSNRKVGVDVVAKRYLIPLHGRRGQHMHSTIIFDDNPPNPQPLYMYLSAAHAACILCETNHSKSPGNKCKSM